jgi:hypothetical protein
MGLISGALDSVKGAARIATAPLRTLGKMAGTSLKTTGSVIGNLATGNLGGAVDAAGNGVSEQIGNVKGHFGEGVKGLKEIVGGHAEFVQGGVGLIGTPIKGAARLAGNRLETSGKVIGELAEGDLGGAVSAFGQGNAQAGAIVGQTAEAQLQNIF